MFMYREEAQRFRCTVSVSQFEWVCSTPEPEKEWVLFWLLNSKRSTHTMSLHLCQNSDEYHACPRLYTAIFCFVTSPRTPPRGECRCLTSVAKQQRNPREKNLDPLSSFFQLHQTRSTCFFIQLPRAPPPEYASAFVVPATNGFCRICSLQATCNLRNMRKLPGLTENSTLGDHIAHGLAFMCTVQRVLSKIRVTANHIIHMLKETWY